MYCTKCGKELANDARFCTYCGAKVQQEEYPGNNKGFTGGYEEKKRAAQELFGFEKSSYLIMKESKIVKKVLSVMKWVFIIFTLFMILQVSSIFDAIGAIVVGVFIIFIVSVLKKGISEEYNELEREYKFHNYHVIQSDDFMDAYTNAQVEGKMRLQFAFASRLKHRKSEKMSDEEWLDYYIELKSAFYNIDFARCFEDYKRRNDANWQMQQQQFQQQAQEFQQQQFQQQEDVNRQMQEFQRQQEIDQQMQQQQFQQQAMDQQMQDQAFQQQMLDQQRQMQQQQFQQQMNDNMFH